MHTLTLDGVTVATSPDPIVFDTVAGAWVVGAMAFADDRTAPRYAVTPDPTTVAKATLADLDAVLPRYAEDIIDSLGPDHEATLPQIVRDRLATKRAARAVIAGAG